MPEKKVLITFNAKNENDQQLFCRDLAESIAEVIFSFFFSFFLLAFAFDRRRSVQFALFTN